MSLDAIKTITNTCEPLWLDTLRQERQHKGLKIVAEEIGYSTAVVSTVLAGKYTGDWAKVEQAVRGAYLGETVRCPVLGELATNRCLEYQRQPYRSTNRTAVMLYRACSTCPNNRKNQKETV